jgi:hypothetical protein
MCQGHASSVREFHLELWSGIGERNLIACANFHFTVSLIMCVGNEMISAWGDESGLGVLCDDDIWSFF